MKLRINEETVADEVIHFKSDDEFADFCVAPYVTLFMGPNGPEISEGRHSDAYLKAIEEGKHFMIEDEKSWVYKHNCVTKRVPFVCKDGLTTPRKDCLVQLPVENLEDYGFYLFEQRVRRKHALKESLKAILYGSDLRADIALKNSGLSKADIKPLADAGDLNAQLVLLLGMVAHDYRTWTEEFVDEETNESTQVERYESLDSTLFEADPGEIEALSRQIEPLIPDQDDETLKRWWQIFCTDALYPAISQELAHRGDADAISAMEEYNYSPLEHPEDLADDFAPSNYSIILSGHPLYLDQIENMVEDLTKAHGTPDNECGLFVPLQFVFETLGFKWVDNTGNLMTTWRRSEAVLSLEIECNPNVDEALVEAFQKAYPLLTVETIDN